MGISKIVERLVGYDTITSDPVARAVYRSAIAMIEAAQEAKKKSGKIFVVYETKEGADDERVYHGFNRGAAREAYHYRGPDQARLEVIPDAGTDNFDDDRNPTGSES